ncbi:hypothetical protein TNCV_2924971 [Trichonephila clavipes]|nr:hypothetical protein TNCV_2924971 [Trichonephila clavipes]
MKGHRSSRKVHDELDEWDQALKLLGSRFHTASRCFILGLEVVARVLRVLKEKKSDLHLSIDTDTVYIDVKEKHFILPLQAFGSHHRVVEVDDVTWLGAEKHVLLPTVLDGYKLDVCHGVLVV